MRYEARQPLQQAVQAYKEAERELFITQAAWLLVVSKTTLYHKINSLCDQVSYITSKQRLTPKEDKSFESWVLHLQSWGFLPRITQLREMAKELLQAKQDFKKLGKTGQKNFSVIIIYYSQNIGVRLIKNNF